MNTYRRLVPLVAFLSLGFLGQSPPTTPSVRRIASAACADPLAKPEPKASSTGFAGQLFPFLGVSSPSPYEIYTQFMQQLRVQVAIRDLSTPGMMGIFDPVFPNYRIPQISDHQVDLRRPDASKQIFGGLMSDPQLKYLSYPGTISSANAELGSASPMKVSLLNQPAPSALTPATKVPQNADAGDVSLNVSTGINASPF